MFFGDLRQLIDCYDRVYKISYFLKPKDRQGPDQLSICRFWTERFLLYLFPAFHLLGFEYKVIMLIKVSLLLVRFGPQEIKVRLGEYDFATSEETRAVDFAISEIRIHRDFALDTFANDIAIVKLYPPTVFDSYIWPVCLPPIDQTFEYKDAVITGILSIFAVSASCSRHYFTLLSKHQFRWFLNML